MTSVNSVPVIDLCKLHEPATLAAIDEACREWGFFQVVNHGVDRDSSEALLRETRAFFARPLAEKRCLTRSPENPWGFYDRELTKNTRDWKQVFDSGSDDDGEQPTPWPEQPEGFQSAVRAFRGACQKLAFRLLGAISLNLGMPSRHLEREFSPYHSSFLRLNYYPECPEPARPVDVSTPSEGVLGVNHHTDAGALTLLLQDEQAGLEVFRAGSWIPIEPRRDALVINIGDIVQVWSNDRYRAALHRVVANPQRARYSAPFFFNPAYESVYAPLPSTASAASPARYRPIQWGEFRGLRADGDYADCGEEVQIHHYRVEDEHRNGEARDSESRKSAAPQEGESHGIH